MHAICRCVGMVDEADSKSVASDGVWVRVPPPAPKRRESERDSLLFGGPPPAGNDPLRSNSWEGIPNPLPSPPHAKLISGSDLDCPGAPKRRESEQDSLLFGGQPAAGNYPLRSNWRGGHSLPSRAHPMQSRQLVRIRIAPDYRKDQFTVIANQ